MSIRILGSGSDAYSGFQSFKYESCLLSLLYVYNSCMKERKKREVYKKGVLKGIF